MSLEDLTKELEEVEGKIEKLEGFLKVSKRKEYMIGDFLESGLAFVPEVLPVTLLPALLGIELYAETIDSDIPVAGKVAMCALATPIALPSIALSAVLALPFAVPALAMSAVMGGAQTTYAGAHNSRITKAEKKLEKLKLKRDELKKEISTNHIRK